MILFSLKCDDGHGFDGWFRSGDDFENQSKRALVACPLCGSTTVRKALMAPALGRANEDAEAARPAEDKAFKEAEPAPQAGHRTGAELTSVAQPAPPIDRATVEAVGELWKALQSHARKVRATADNVGSRFAEEARRIHYEESEHRPIYGEASRKEVEALEDEGILVMPMPPLPEDSN